VVELSACIEWLFAEEPVFDNRVRAAAAAGLGCVEFWTWRDKDIRALRTALEETGVRLTTFVSEPESQLVDPKEHAAFIGGVEKSARVAASLDCHSLIVVAGDDRTGVAREEQHRAVVAALRAAAPGAAAYGVDVLLEPLNSRVDHMGHFLDSTAEGFEMIEEVGASNVRLLYDMYHSVVMGERPEEVLSGRVELVGHIHLADAPGRHEPGSGTIDWPKEISWLRESGYRGRLGLEYMPTEDTAKTLGQIASLVSAAP
jgi:hydroxypyruvate isomerase